MSNSSPKKGRNLQALAYRAIPRQTYHATRNSDTVYKTVLENVRADVTAHHRSVKEWAKSVRVPIYIQNFLTLLNYYSKPEFFNALITVIKHNRKRYDITDAIDYRSRLYVAVHQYPVGVMTTTSSTFTGKASLYVWNRISSQLSGADSIELPGVREIKKIYASPDGQLNIIVINNSGITELRQFGYNDSGGVVFRVIRTLGVGGFPQLPDGLATASHPHEADQVPCQSCRCSSSGNRPPHPILAAVTSPRLIFVPASSVIFAYQTPLFSQFPRSTRTTIR
jgi:hypothetical protein